VDDRNDVDQALKRRHAAGWCVGDTAFVTEAGVLVWLVSEVNGETVIRAEGPTQVGPGWRRVTKHGRAGCSRASGYRNVT
jgi:hypothetical protein